MNIESQHYKDLKAHLREMFQLNQADLDFGIYRIMNHKRHEVEDFLDNQLLPQVRRILQQNQPNDKTAIQSEITKLESGLHDAGIDPETSPKVRELKQKLSQGFDISALESEIYSDLYNFFRRYYNEGDFMSMRRYKDGVYAIPYSGEEVKLHWANHDQYYIKTSENFQNYAFKIDGQSFHFELISAGTERNNNKEKSDKQRRFFLAEQKTVTKTDDEGEEYTVVIKPVSVTDKNDVIIRFTYDFSDQKQDELNKSAEEILKNNPEHTDALLQLWGLSPTEKDKNRTLFAKYITDYTAKNSFDYFIHKDLGKFLRQELDFYIKNEIMHLDDIENQTADYVAGYLSKIRAMRAVANKIITFLASLEDFQKRLWLKKKFVLDTHYCVTLDRVLKSDQADELLAIIAQNQEQIDEWVKLFAIDEIKGDLSKIGFDVFRYDGTLQKAIDFLRQNDKLLIDTKFFPSHFKYRLLSLFDNLDAQTDGVLINSENFQALNLLQERYREKIKCIYIDPPYNTGDDKDFFYRDDIRHSSWITMIDNRITLSKEVLSNDGSFYCQLDYNESARFKLLVDNILSFEREIIWSNESSSGFKAQANTWIRGHDTIYFYSKNGNADFCKQHLPLADSTKRRYDKTDSETGEKYKEYHEDDGSIRKVYLSQSKGKPISTIWTDIIGFQTNNAGREHIDFSTQKPTNLIGRTINASSTTKDFVTLDYFAGSGTTGHAVINLNREDSGSRKYILVEMGEYFNSVTKPRIQKAAYSKDWKDGKPVSRDGVSHIIKYMTLEQYEDSLDNLGDPHTGAFGRNARQQDAFDAINQKDKDKKFYEGYMLSYMLDVESRGSQSLLNLDSFKNPFDYKMKITRNNDTQMIAVDLIETFNYLLGLVVQTVDQDKSGMITIKGLNAADENCLIIWRNTEKINNDTLNDWFKKRYSAKDFEFDAIYINGDNTIENMKIDGDNWKVRLIEAEFKRLMFADH